jgi:DNA-binding MarR family transcriptional regulator
LPHGTGREIRSGLKGARDEIRAEKSLSATIEFSVLLSSGEEMKRGVAKHESRDRSVEQVADRLHSAAIHLLRRVRKQDTAMGEGPARLSALSVLVFGGSMSLGQLAAAEQVRPPTMTRIVTGLEKNGLAERVSDSADARRVQIRATPKGVRLMRGGRKARIEYLARQLAMLTKDELSTLGEAVEVLQCVLQRWN